MNRSINIVFNECLHGIFQRTDIFANILISHLFPKFTEFLKETGFVDGHNAHLFANNAPCQVRHFCNGFQGSICCQAERSNAYHGVAGTRHISNIPCMCRKQVAYRIIIFPGRNIDPMLGKGDQGYIHIDLVA